MNEPFKAARRRLEHLEMVALMVLLELFDRRLEKNESCGDITAPPGGPVIGWCSFGCLPAPPPPSFSLTKPTGFNPSHSSETKEDGVLLF